MILKASAEKGALSAAARSISVSSLALGSVPVMGGILCLLFGSIAVVGLSTLIRHQVDLSEARNLIIVSVPLVFGIGGMTFGYGEFSLSGISLCAIVALVLNLALPGGEGWNNKQLDENS